MQSVICSLQSVVRSLQSVVCSLQSAVCKCQTPLADTLFINSRSVCRHRLFAIVFNKAKTWLNVAVSKN